MAERLRLPDDERRCVELAARLHALDELGVAELAPVPSLREVAALITGYRRLLADGQRRGRRAARARGPIGPHIIGAANTYDELTSGVRQPRIGRAEALARLARDRATFRADVLAALAEAVEQRADPGRRRRADDARDSEARGAA
jgi:hypothetical protein